MPAAKNIFVGRLSPNEDRHFFVVDSHNFFVRKIEWLDQRPKRAIGSDVPIVIFNGGFKDTVIQFKKFRVHRSPNILRWCFTGIGNIYKNLVPSFRRSLNWGEHFYVSAYDAKIGAQFFLALSRMATTLSLEALAAIPVALTVP